MLQTNDKDNAKVQNSSDSGNNISGSGQAYNVHEIIQQYLSACTKVKVIDHDISVDIKK